MSGTETIENYLQSYGVDYQVQVHPLAYTANRVAQSEGIPGKAVAKVVIARAGGELIMLALPASRRVDLLKLSRSLGKDCTLASEGEFAARFPEVDAGAMPPLGDLYGMPTYVDRSLAEDVQICMQAGTHTNTITMLYRDFARVTRPMVLDFTRDRSLAGSSDVSRLRC